MEYVSFFHQYNAIVLSYLSNVGRAVSTDMGLGPNIERTVFADRCPNMVIFIFKTIKKLKM